MSEEEYEPKQATVVVHGATNKSDDLRASLKDSLKDTGLPQRRYANIFLSVCSFILVTEMCERLAYYGLTGSLSIFFRSKLDLSSNLSTQMNNTFASFNYATPLIGAWLADQYYGR